MKWVTSTYSNPDGNCVEVAVSSQAILVRDTRDRQGGTISVRPRQWSKFLERARLAG